MLSPSTCVGHVVPVGEQDVGDPAGALDGPDGGQGEPGTVD